MRVESKLLMVLFGVPLTLIIGLWQGRNWERTEWQDLVAATHANLSRACSAEVRREMGAAAKEPF